MRRLPALLTAAALAAIQPAAVTAAAPADVDLLVARLVDKGILSAEEATALLAEMQSARAAVPVQELTAAAPPAPPTGGSESWADRFTVKGDFRLRYQTDDLDGLPPTLPIDVDERDRYRIRWRLGVDAVVTEGWRVGFGLASGGSDARSTNQTLSAAFSTGDARLDYAYAAYTMNETSEFVAGKFTNPIWEPKDLLWDSDIRPEGAAARFTFEPADGVSAFVTPAYLVLSEDIADLREDAAIWALQAGAHFALNDATTLTVAPAYFAFENTEGTPGPIALAVPSNSRDVDGNLLYDYDAATLGAALTIAGVGPLPQLQVFGEWVEALDPSDDNTGWLAGVSFGDAKVANFGDWQVVYNFRRLERDAWPEFLGDSESFFGATNYEGNEIELSLGLARNVALAVDYYSDFEFLGTGVEQRVLLVDLNLKW